MLWTIIRGYSWAWALVVVWPVGSILVLAFMLGVGADLPVLALVLTAVLGGYLVMVAFAAPVAASLRAGRWLVVEGSDPDGARGRAVLQLHQKGPKVWEATMFVAAPKARGLGTEMGEWVFDLAARERICITLEAMPPLVATYKRWGAVRLGRSWIRVTWRMELDKR